MQDIFDVPGSAAPDSTAPRLDFEWLDVYRIAMECAALFDVLGNLGLIPRPLCLRARGLLVRIVQMHTRLCLRSKA